MNSVYVKLLNAKKTFGKIVRTQLNTFVGKKYADLATVINSIEKALEENGLGFYQSVEGEQIVNITENTDAKGVKTTNVVITGMKVVTTVFSEDGEIKSYYPFILFSPDPQKQGAAYTYARRYALQAAMGLASEDDDAQSVVHPTQSKLSTQPKTKPTPQSVTSKESVQPTTTTITGIDYFKNLPDVKVEENETGEVFVSGKTYAYSSSLKKLGFVFSAESKSWVKKAEQKAA